MTSPTTAARDHTETQQRTAASNIASIALAHHWMEFFRGGEAVLDEFSRLFPKVPIHILVYNEKNLPPSLLEHPFHASALQKIPVLKARFRNLLPFFPEIIRGMRVAPSTRFVLSSDASMIKGVTLPEDAIHVCYCHSPPRYLWGLQDSYLESSSHGNRLGRWLFSAALPRLRRFDRRMAQQVDRFIANSRCVQERISRVYNRDSVVIHPPVNVDRFNPHRRREDFYLVVSALVPYKRIDLAVEACSRLRRKLVVIGTGPEEADLKRRGGDCVTFLGWQSNDVVRDHYERCRAFIFPGIEDFGITPCEAQAAGAPVLAFGQGGALETVADGKTGLFFDVQSTESMMECLRRFEASPSFSSASCRANVDHLRPARFRSEMRRYLEQEFPDIFAEHPWPNDPDEIEWGPVGGPSTPSPFTKPAATAKRTLNSIRTIPKSPRNPWDRTLQTAAFVAAAAGSACAIYLSFRATGDLSSLPWIPESIGRWADDHGRLRNLPAYFLLTLPVLFAVRSAVGRLIAAVAVSLFGTLLELGEFFVPQRMVEWQDVAWTWAGAFAAWAAFETARVLAERFGTFTPCQNPS